MILRFETFQEIANGVNGDSFVFLQFQKVPITANDQVSASIQGAGQYGLVGRVFRDRAGDRLVISGDDKGVILQESYQSVDIPIRNVVFVPYVRVIQC